MHSQEFVPAKKKLSLIPAHYPLTGLCSGQRTTRRGPWRHGLHSTATAKKPVCCPWNADWFSSLLCAFVYFRIPLSMCNNVASSLVTCKSVPASSQIDRRWTLMECLCACAMRGTRNWLTDWTESDKREIKSSKRLKRDFISYRDNYTRLTRSFGKQASKKEPQKSISTTTTTTNTSTKISSLWRMFCRQVLVHSMNLLDCTKIEKWSEWQRVEGKVQTVYRGRDDTPMHSVRIRRIP